MDKEAIKELWDTVNASGKNSWYEHTIDFWKKQEASINGVLCGQTSISFNDLNASIEFIKQLTLLSLEKGGPLKLEKVLDCGAGVGRVTEGCLIKLFEKVDLLEPVPHLLEKARNNLANNPKIEEYILKPLQDYTPEFNSYDCIWLQWCVLYLTDDALIDLLKRLSDNIRHNGIICIKENVILSGINFHYDKVDNSIIRTDRHYRWLFKEAGLSIIAETKQPKYPSHYFPVMMYALRKLH